ncbi:hypothetical protein V5P93_004193 [Actinokineospora auranticolor]|nr:hypothetical protein [Actinokineospora auranticolor]
MADSEPGPVIAPPRQSIWAQGVEAFKSGWGIAVGGARQIRRAPDRIPLRPGLGILRALAVRFDLDPGTESAPSITIIVDFHSSG